MEKEKILKKLAKAIANLEVEDSRKLTLQSIKAGISAQLTIQKGISRGLEIVGKKYEKKEYFLTELIMASIIAEEGLRTLEPYLNGKIGNVGIVVIGTVKGDFHDLGKNILVTLLKTAGLKVHDLGTDVSAEKFVERVEKLHADILALSALLTGTIQEIKKIIDLLKDADLKDKVTVIVGGKPVTQRFADEIGADFYCKDAMEGLKKATEIISRQKRGEKSIL